MRQAAAKRKPSVGPTNLSDMVTPENNERSLCIVSTVRNFLLLQRHSFAFAKVPLCFCKGTALLLKRHSSAFAKAQLLKNSPVTSCTYQTSWATWSSSYYHPSRAHPERKKEGLRFQRRIVTRKSKLVVRWTHH